VTTGRFHIYHFISSLLLTISLGYTLSAQEIHNKQLIRPGMSDSESIMSILNTASRFQNSDPDTMIALAQVALQQSLKKGFTTGTGWSYVVLATGYRNIRQLNLSVLYYKKALALLEQQSYHKAYYLASTWNALFGAYFPLGMYDSAALCCYKVIDMYKSARSVKAPESATVYPLIDAYHNLSICWEQLGYYQYALKYLNKAEQLSRQGPHRDYRMAEILQTKGGIYLDKGVTDSALFFTRAGMDYALAMKDSIRYNSLLVNEAATLLQQNEITGSIAILNRILTNDNVKSNKPDLYIIASFLLAEACLRQKDYNKALKILQPALQQAEAMHLKYAVASPHEKLAKIYYGLQRYKDAYLENKTAQTLTDSLRNNDKVQAVNLMDITLQMHDKDKQIIYQQSKIQRKNLLISAISVSTFLILFVAVLLYYNTKQKQRLQEAHIRSIHKEQEITNLKAMIKGEEKERDRFAKELHDGFIGELSAIKMNLSTINMPRKEEEKLQENIYSLEELIKDLRTTAHDLMPEVLLNQGLKKAILLYGERIATTYELPINVQFIGDMPQLEQEFELSLYRMIQEGVQNIIKHAKATQAIVQLQVSNHTLALTIEDNGIGMGPDLKDTRKGAGLKNLSKRAGELGGSLNITSSGITGTSLYFEFELI
jgi:signal transduction histidine kinase